MTDPLGQSQVIPYLQGLSKKGYSFFLLSCEKKEAYEQRRETVQKILATSGITWVPLKYTKKPPVLSTLVDIIKLRKAAKKIHLQHTLNLVHTRPGVPALVGLWLKQRYGIKFLNDIREFYADSRVDGGIWKRSNILYDRIYKFFRKKEYEQVIQSDGIVCLTYAAEAIIKQSPEYRPGTPMKVIPCSADLELFDPASITDTSKSLLQSRLGIAESDFVLSYLGSIGGWYLTAEMMLFCKRLLNKMPDAKFLFISPHLHEHIVTKAAEYGVPRNKIISVKAARAEVPGLLSLSNYSIFFIKPCYSKLSSSPTKHGELMAMGIPVISNSGVGDVKEIIKRFNGGFVIDSFDATTYDGVIGQMENAIFDSKAIRQGAFEFYALENAVKSYVDLYDEILNADLRAS